MTSYEDELDIEITDEQFEQLRKLGISDERITGMSMAEADELIAELLAENEVGR